MSEPAVIHRLASRLGIHVCGTTHHPWDKATNLERNVTCPRCKELRRIFRKGGKLRGELAGATK